MICVVCGFVLARNSRRSQKKRARKAIIMCHFQKLKTAHVTYGHEYVIGKRYDFDGTLFL